MPHSVSYKSAFLPGVGVIGTYSHFVLGTSVDVFRVQGLSTQQVSLYSRKLSFSSFVPDIGLHGQRGPPWSHFSWSEKTPRKNSSVALWDIPLLAKANRASSLKTLPPRVWTVQV